MDTQQPAGVLQRQAGGHSGAPIAALGEEPLVAQPAHQLGPSAGDPVTSQPVAADLPLNP